MILAERHSSGLRVQLIHDEAVDSTVVVVKEGPHEFVLVGNSGKQALDMFYHPFAYGGWELELTDDA